MADTIVTMTSPEGATLNTAGTYCEGNIEVVPKLQSKTATTGEIVTADDGYVGMSKVDTNPAFEAGKKSEYDAFWDTYQLGCSDDNFDFAFAGKGWKNSNFKPKHSMKPKRTQYMFSSTNIAGDLAQILEDCGVSIDTSEATYFTQMFSNAARITRVPPIDISNAVDYYTDNFFSSCCELVTVDLLTVSEKTSVPHNFFYLCPSLTNLTIAGTIGKSGFNTSWSPLSKASLTSVVNALSTTTTGLTVTLRLAAVNTAFETTAGAADGSTSEEWTALIATKPNWTINLINS